MLFYIRIFSSFIGWFKPTSSLYEDTIIMKRVRNISSKLKNDLPKGDFEYKLLSHNCGQPTLAKSYSQTCLLLCSLFWPLINNVAFYIDVLRIGEVGMDHRRSHTHYGGRSRAPHLLKVEGPLHARTHNPTLISVP